MAEKKNTDTLNAREVMNRLRVKYAAPEFAFLTNVADGTGGGSSRYADALAMGLWPSRGLRLTGFEIKVARSDWLKELEQPAKAEAICRYCDHWYVVVGDDSIVKYGELPPTWGLICPRGPGLKVVNEAPTLSAVPMDRIFLAALLRRSVEQGVDAEVLKKARDESYAAGEKDGHRRGERAAKDNQARVARLEEFEQYSGVNIGDRHTWQEAKDIGTAVRMVLKGEHVNIPDRLRNLRESASRIIAQVDKELAELSAGQEVFA